MVLVGLNEAVHWRRAGETALVIQVQRASLERVFAVDTAVVEMCVGLSVAVSLGHPNQLQGGVIEVEWYTNVFGVGRLHLALGGHNQRFKRVLNVAAALGAVPRTSHSL